MLTWRHAGNRGGPAYRKGIRLTFRNWDVDIEWQHKRNRRRRWWPREEFSFLFNSAVRPWNRFTRREGWSAGKAARFLRRPVRRQRPLKIRWSDLFAPPVVLITASGLQG